MLKYIIGEHADRFRDFMNTKTARTGTELVFSEKVFSKLGLSA
jgi:hypothetical protein